jgi:hypothetical protein
MPILESWGSVLLLIMLTQDADKSAYRLFQVVDLTAHTFYFGLTQDAGIQSVIRRVSGVGFGRIRF